MTSYLVDMNVIVASIRADHPHHEQALAFLREARALGDETRVTVELLASAMRILTLQIWVAPETSAPATELLQGWLRATRARTVVHQPKAWAVLAEWATALALSSRAVPDALLAASSVADNATLVTFDRGFSRFEGVHVRVLAAA